RSPGGARCWGCGGQGEMRAAIDAARYTWMPRMMFVLVPFFAWLVAIVRRPAGRRFPAHFVFALAVHAAAFAVQAWTKGMAAFSPDAVARGLVVVSDLYILGYIFL